ncbi:hypothetical protein K503DRAFT_488294 [Rhizopogon vinicolor AM-OR11-026]|uniref:Major facilitator superfamily (MFS) profile domain-containing protein n=1 Tax=Rhizopogon vinicolor AM-OR11-026 TaxID=1314800 RepID=A0A1B7MMK6_9AGAM|nr:hypothetical protein K503DRAFT_488294 [Rhizopogon vinicolor AM-OR11-026]
MEKIGIRVGMAYSLVSFSALIGEPIAGVILTRDNGSYTSLIVFTGVSENVLLFRISSICSTINLFFHLSSKARSQ